MLKFHLKWQSLDNLNKVTESFRKHLCVKCILQSLPLFELDSNITNTVNNSLKSLPNSLLEKTHN